MCYEIIKDGCFEMRRGNSKIVPARFENKTSYRLLNPGQRVVSKVSFDLCKEANESCCDHLFIIENTDNFRYIFVELKSSDVSKAVEQILLSIKNYRSCLIDKIVDGRIVTTKTHAPDLVTSGYKRLQRYLKRTGGDLITKSQTLEEKI